MATALSWLVLPPIGFLLFSLGELAYALRPEQGQVAMSLWFHFGALLNVAAIEACKMASLAWICARRWDDWAPLGIAFGILKAIGILVYWALDRHAFGSLVPFSAMLLVASANVLLLHLALGRLAAGGARPPGSPRLALGLASCAAAALTLGPTELLTLLPNQPAFLVEYQPLAMFAVLLGFVLLVQHRVPWPAGAPEPGPAREFVAAGGVAILVLTLAIFLIRSTLEPDWSERLPVALALAIGLSFVAALFARQVVQPWLRQGQGHRVGEDEASSG